jgi:putative membrane protein
MIKNIFGGMAVGVANIIPGVSGGTMMVIVGIFDRLMESVNNIFKFKNENRLKDIWFLAQVLIGVFIGLIAFAKVIEWLFGHYEVQTMFWFVGLILFSIPALLKRELKDNKISPIFVFIGMVVIFSTVLLAPDKSEVIISKFPEVTAIHLIIMVLVGIISGATMLLPGVSGSMVMLIIGQYYLFKSYVANVTSFDMKIMIPLIALGFGIALGVLISAKLITYFLGHHRSTTVSLILGLIIASAIAMVPFGADFSGSIIITSIIAFIVGSGIVVLIDRVSG